MIASAQAASLSLIWVYAPVRNPAPGAPPSPRFCFCGLGGNSLALLLLAGCGYHTLGAATHLPPGVKTISIPVFATRTDLNGTERLMTEALLRELTARTRLRVTPANTPAADAVLHGEILRNPLLRSPTTSPPQQSSSFLITVVASGHAQLKRRHGPL